MHQGKKYQSSKDKIENHIMKRSGWMLNTREKSPILENKAASKYKKSKYNNKQNILGK